MRSMKRTDTDGQRGEIMLEAAIIFIPVLLLLLMMLSLTFLFYEEAMMNSIANEIAENVAVNLKYRDLGPNDDPMPDNIASERMFRLTFGESKVEGDQKDWAEAYANWRIPLTTFGIGGDEAQVECKVSLSGIGRAYVQVTVKRQTEIFLGGVLTYLGILEDDSEVGATAYAECVDLMGYTSLINFVEYASNKLSAFNPVGKLYSEVKGLLEAAGF